MLEGRNHLRVSDCEPSAPREAPLLACLLERPKAAESLLCGAIHADAHGVDGRPGLGRIQHISERCIAPVEPEDKGLASGHAAADELDGPLGAGASLVDRAGLGQVVEQRPRRAAGLLADGAVDEPHARRSSASIHCVASSHLANVHLVRR